MSERSRARCSTRSGTATSWSSSRTAPACSTSTATSLHEVTSPQAFDGLRVAGRKLRRPDATIAVIDHNIATDGPARRLTSRRRRAGIQVRDAGEERRRVRRALIPMLDVRQGIVHIIGPELGIACPA